MQHRYDNMRALQSSQLARSVIIRIEDELFVYRYRALPVELRERVSRLCGAGDALPTFSILISGYPGLDLGSFGAVAVGGRKRTTGPVTWFSIDIEYIPIHAFETHSIARERELERLSS
jgi:hypothetical protein